MVMGRLRNLLLHALLLLALAHGVSCMGKTQLLPKTIADQPRVEIQARPCSPLAQPSLLRLILHVAAHAPPHPLPRTISTYRKVLCKAQRPSSLQIF